MNLLNRLTIKNLKLNKKRTLVTIIGIMLATSLITGVATLVSSFTKSIIEMEKKQNGDYHYCFYDVPVDELKYIENNRNVEDFYCTKNIGYSLCDSSENEYKPYYYIKAYSDKALKNLDVKMVEGRLPENENEIVVSRHVITNAKINVKVGDELDLKIGKRMTENGYELDQSNPYHELDIEYDEEGNKVKEDEIKETFSPEFSRTYKVVGIIERPSYDTEGHSAPGYTLITRLEDFSGEKMNVYVKYKNVKKHVETTAKIQGIDAEILEKMSKNDLLSVEENKALDNAKYAMTSNNGLIRWEAFEFSDGNLTMLYSVATVVIVIIMITSVFCIRNSFEISITEKIKQYGMLASVGATSKQIRKNVLYEAIILAIIGIPLGILSGLLAMFILIKVVEKILADSLLGVELMFSPNLIAILVSALLALITIYLSAKKSAKTASKVSPIEAIRSNQDVKIKSKKLKTPWIIKKMFGIGGDIAYKNLKRNNKKYRTTVVSIVVSVAIFIAMNTFLEYAFEISKIYYKDYTYNIAITSTNLSKQTYDKLVEVSKMEGIKAYSLTRTIFLEKKTEDLEKHYSKEKKDIDDSVQRTNSGGISYIDVVAVGKQEYDRFLKKNGLDYDKCKDKAILVDTYTEYVKVDGKESYAKYKIYDYKKGDMISGKIGDKDVSLEIAKCVEEKTMGFENRYFSEGLIVVSDEFIEKYEDNYESSYHLYLNAEDPDKLEDDINKAYPTDFEEIYNVNDNMKQEKSMFMVIAIFLYGFIIVISLIGVTNIFNTITTNMELRQKEFANLKSIGMTKKEFNRMIRLESFLYGSKSLIIGIPIGTALSYLIYKKFSTLTMVYCLPYKGIIISTVVVALLITFIMKFSLNKINKQNIIETIRKDNI